jgi:hypothetical protein
MRPTRWNLVLAGLATISLTACFSRPPPIARGLPAIMRDIGPAFTERVSTRFPVGSSSREMVTELRSQHFNMRPTDPGSPYGSVATAHNFNGACDLKWTIYWAAKADQITAIEGGFSANCL